MHICIHTYIIHIYIHIHNVYIYIYIYTYIHTRTHVYAYVSYMWYNILWYIMIACYITAYANCPRVSLRARQTPHAPARSWPALRPIPICIYIYIHMYVKKERGICKYTCMYTYIYIYIYVHVYIYIYK